MANAQDDQAPTPEVLPSTPQLHAMKAMKTQACSQGKTQVEPTSEPDSPRLQEHIATDEYVLEDKSHTNEQVLLSSATMACQSKIDDNKTVKSERLTSGHSSTPTSSDSSSSESKSDDNRTVKSERLTSGHSGTSTSTNSSSREGYLADDSDSGCKLTDTLRGVISESNRSRETSEPGITTELINPSAQPPSWFLETEEDDLNVQTMESTIKSSTIRLLVDPISDPPAILSGVLDKYVVPDYIRERISKYLYFTLIFIYTKYNSVNAY